MSEPQKHPLYRLLDRTWFPSRLLRASVEGWTWDGPPKATGEGQRRALLRCAARRCLTLVEPPRVN